METQDARWFVVDVRIKYIYKRCVGVHTYNMYPRIPLHTYNVFYAASAAAPSPAQNTLQSEPFTHAFLSCKSPPNPGSHHESTYALTRVLSATHSRKTKFLFRLVLI